MCFSDTARIQKYANLTLTLIQQIQLKRNEKAN